MHTQWKNVFNILLMQQSCRTTHIYNFFYIDIFFCCKLIEKLVYFSLARKLANWLKFVFFYLLQMVFYTSHSYLAFENSCVLIDLLLDVLSTTRIKNVNALLHWWLFYELTLFYVDFRPLIQYLNLSSPLISTNVPWRMQRNSARDKWG